MFANGDTGSKETSLLKRVGALSERGGTSQEIPRLTNNYKYLMLEIFMTILSFERNFTSQGNCIHMG